MHKAITVMLLVVSSVVFGAENHVSTVPPNTELAQYPVVTERAMPKTLREGYELEAKLGLRPVVLSAPLKAFNHYRLDNSWRYEEISKGAIVFVDTSGVVRYKADCWNRLVVIRSWFDEFLAWVQGGFSFLERLFTGAVNVFFVSLGVLMGFLMGRFRRGALGR